MNMIAFRPHRVSMIAVACLAASVFAPIHAEAGGHGAAGTTANTGVQGDIHLLRDQLSLLTQRIAELEKSITKPCTPGTVATEAGTRCQSDASRAAR